MMPSMPQLETDDAAFVATVDELVHGLVLSMEPSSAYLIRVDNWFSPRWLGFAAKVCHGLLGVGRDITKDAAPIPPFVPNRVVSEHRFVRTDGEYVASDDLRPLHKRQHSAENEQRKLMARSTDGLFVWCSGASAANARASVMAVVTKASEQDVWYAGFVKRDDRWSYGHLSGIGRDHLARIRARAVTSTTLPLSRSP